MMLTSKHCFRLLLITLLIVHLTGCATYQRTIPPDSTREDKWFARDKLKHFTASFLISAAAYSAARWGNASKDDASITGFAFSSSCGIAKEINDKARRNNWSYKDLVWDFIGGGGGASLSNALD